MLPAVLPAAPAEPAPVAVDYRFDDAKQQLVPYAIRLQRFTGSLPEGELLATAYEDVRLPDFATCRTADRRCGLCALHTSPAVDIPYMRAVLY
jgi:hypothetical protein